MKSNNQSCERGPGAEGSMEEAKAQKQEGRKIIISSRRFKERCLIMLSSKDGLEHTCGGRDASHLKKPAVAIAANLLPVMAVKCVWACTTGGNTFKFSFWD